MLSICEFVSRVADSPLAEWAHSPPWEVTSQAAVIVERLMQALPAPEYRIANGIAIHVSATVEPNAILKPPIVLAAGVFVASAAYLRGGCWLAEGCAVGPAVELKSVFAFQGTSFAHFNFAGDSIVGSQVNFEAGAVVCNHRNERPSVAFGAFKFGALVGDNSRIGANAVLAPGTVLPKNSIVGRLELVDQELIARGTVV